MFQIQHIKPEQLASIQIKNQHKIVELTGSKLDLQHAWEVIKKESGNFSESSQKAMEADTLLAELLVQHGISIPSQKPGSSSSTIQMRERERARKIKILQLKLNTAA